MIREVYFKFMIEAINEKAHEGVGLKVIKNRIKESLSLGL
tara:strand:- start:3424 stop:3543 length:120 start_codon:yes stop_codon:yes gene_type:complete